MTKYKFETENLHNELAYRFILLYITSTYKIEYPDNYFTTFAR